MIWFITVIFGFGLGLLFFGTLWLAVRHFVRFPKRRILIAASGLARVLLLTVALYMMSRQGYAKLLAGLAGLWMARVILICRLDGIHHGS